MMLSSSIVTGLIVHDFMCAVLGLQPARNDGDPAVTRDMLRSNR